MIIKNENKGQGSIEFLFLISFSIVTVLLMANFLGNIYDFNLAILAAKNGINPGLNAGRISVLEESAYDKYKINNTVLIHPNSIKIVKIETINRGFDDRYNKTSIQIRVYASSTSLISREDMVSIGEKINFSLRKSITLAFNTNNLSNGLYNPCFSKKHLYTTANVQWV
ncbi:hypothetical protein SDC9_08624 [bioreactor metagenome]|uniref:Uncharacterized protein n=1 Tax=bioreactor metagenome TaxID=1076179 RepID=A0A644T866_9ZZZZ|nr:hypothetical protein [Methanobrevibacter sp.]MEA4957662.1 hypothetical protein [Methanobrevibacter sp.]